MHGYCSFANNILLFFFSLLHLTISFSLWCFHSHLSLFLSLVPQSHLTDLRSKLATADRCRSKLIRWSKLTCWSVLGFSVWSVGFGVLIFLILCLISFGIFCLISGFWGFDPVLFFVWSVGDGGWWWWVDDGGWVGWWWVWIDRWWWLGLWWVCERVLKRSVKMNILLNKCVE